MDDRKLIIGLVLGVGVHDDSAPSTGRHRCLSHCCAIHSLVNILSLVTARQIRSAQMPVILSIDQGTTNTKAILVTANGDVVAAGSAPVGVTSPHPGWVEQDADRIWTSVIEAVGACLAGADVRIVGIALSTQRETVVSWRSSTGEPLGPVIGWQDRRSADWCAEALDVDARRLVQERTALRVDPMFSAPKMTWVLDHLPIGVPVEDVRLGTVDSWLIWRLTAGREHLTEAGNASRTLLYDISELSWSDDLLAIFGVPPSVLPKPVASDHGFGADIGCAGGSGRHSDPVRTGRFTRRPLRPRVHRGGAGEGHLRHGIVGDDPRADVASREARPSRPRWRGSAATPRRTHSRATSCPRARP